jgi:hypothetical protein
MRAIRHSEVHPFAKAKKKADRKNPDVRSAGFANNRRGARPLPTRQFNRGR